MNIYYSAEELIGKTPLVRLANIEKKFSTKAKIIAKLESFNPCGSAKDRIALEMIRAAEACGKLKKGSTIIEPTSGNTGIGLAAVGRLRGYKTIIVMPDTMSAERQKIIKAYGGEVVLTDGKYGMTGAIRTANKMAEIIPDSFIPDQFSNPDNPAAHYKTTGPEIYKDTDGTLDVFVSAIGTGGTISGVGKYLKEQNPNIKIVGAEPLNSAILSGGKAGPHKIQGIGAGFIPNTLDRDIIDEIIPVSDEDAYNLTREIARCEGILAGISSGAALAAAVKVAEKKKNAGKSIVVLFPDSGERYLTTDLF